MSCRNFFHNAQAVVLGPAESDALSRYNEWSEWDERHGRYSREVAVERCGSSRDTNADSGTLSGKRTPVWKSGVKGKAREELDFAPLALS